VKLGLPKFIDHHPQFSASGYIATNEEPDLFNRILGDLKVKRALSIASGGEVLLSVVLPRAAEIVAIDHSYKSLAACYTKMLLLQRVQPSVLQLLLRDEKYTEFKQHLPDLWEQLPETLRQRARTAFEADYELTTLRKEWNTGASKLRKLRPTSVRKVTLMHGDIKDVKEPYGTFDLFYASNAIEHTGRNAGRPTYNHFADLLNPGGLLLVTVAHYTRYVTPSGFELVKVLRGIYSQWNHAVLRKPL
jgi:hypothetical protein